MVNKNVFKIEAYKGSKKKASLQVETTLSSVKNSYCTVMLALYAQYNLRCNSK